MPDGLMSPANPHLVGPATVNGSRGLEGMAISPNGKTLTFILEGAVVGAPDPFSRRIYEYDIASGTFTRLADYRTEVAGHFVSDVQALDNHRLVVIERDGGRGLTANFRRVYSGRPESHRRRRRSRQDPGRRPGRDPRSGSRLAAGASTPATSASAIRSG